MSIFYPSTTHSFTHSFIRSIVCPSTETLHFYDLDMPCRLLFPRFRTNILTWISSAEIAFARRPCLEAVWMTRDAPPFFYFHPSSTKHSAPNHVSVPCNVGQHDTIPKNLIRHTPYPSYLVPLTFESNGLHSSGHLICTLINCSHSHATQHMLHMNVP
jgi:hypothetical protein